MPTYNMHEAKTQLSRLAERAAAGEEIVIARNGTPVAKLVAADRRKQRRLGLWKGQVQVGDDFEDPLPADIQEALEGRRP
ncbi:MAG TPA: type II toxin-antitoxin system prevent-host-death family antitoxin [Solirubrobacteraceae bacterium]|jgi:prevent-host-death family protein|nr:type II toxin-antitoxin system prevent-host-death family antitoxin [Solirubrobacteraceae bacterium]